MLISLHILSEGGKSLKACDFHTSSQEIYLEIATIENQCTAPIYVSYFDKTEEDKPRKSIKIEPLKTFQCRALLPLCARIVIYHPERQTSYHFSEDEINKIHYLIVKENYSKKILALPGHTFGNNLLAVTISDENLIDQNPPQCERFTKGVRIKPL